MHIKKGSHFKIEGAASLPDIVGIATTDPDQDGFFRAQIYSSLYPLGTNMRVIKSAPNLLISGEEFEQFKAELEQRATNYKAGKKS
jgi:hypothetical protein